LVKNARKCVQLASQPKGERVSGFFALKPQRFVKR
jgi:hypothetical protein